MPAPRMNRHPELPLASVARLDRKELRPTELAAGRGSTQPPYGNPGVPVLPRTVASTVGSQNRNTEIGNIMHPLVPLSRLRMRCWPDHALQCMPLQEG